MPPKLAYGLNLASKKQDRKTPLQNAFTARPGQKRKKTIFDDDFDEEDNEDGQNEAKEENITEISTFGSVEEEPAAPTAAPPPKKQTKTSDKPPDPSRNSYVNLSSLRTSRKYAEEAQEIDPTIYDYDAVYDSLHAAPEADKKKAASEGPRYINALLQSAQVRKRDQLRARERMLQREREAEGEEFADKEKFVTSAYKAQQEEARRLEEEEERKAKEEEEKRKKGGGMVAFYKDVLDRDESRHEAAVRAAQELAEKKKRGEVIEETETTATDEESEAKRAEALKAKGANVVINENGEIVDKRQLLSAGLNVAKKKPATEESRQQKTGATATTSRYGAGAPGYRRDGGPRAAQRERQTEMLAAQLEEKMRAQQAEEEAKQKELAEKIKSHRSTTDVQSARERYLARKREREAAAQKGK